MPAIVKSEHRKSRIIGLKEVVFRTGWSESKIRRYMKAGKFPAQADKLEGSRSAGWIEDQIDDFVLSVTPEPIQKDRSMLAREVSQAEVAEADHPHLPLSLNLRNGAAPQRRKVKAAEDETLIRTGMKLQGQDVFCHLPSRRLLVAVGSMSDEFLAAFTNISA
jgi:predicted DNA-binding transcriptional regulator AlpA